MKAIILARVSTEEQREIKKEIDKRNNKK